MSDYTRLDTEAGKWFRLAPEFEGNRLAEAVTAAHLDERLGTSFATTEDEPFIMFWLAVTADPRVLYDELGA